MNAICVLPQHKYIKEGNLSISTQLNIKLNYAKT